MSTHDGHRQRMKNAFAEHGLESFDDVHALEFLLFYVHARCNTNEIAHELLDRFGSLDAVFEASVEELSNVDGVGRETAIFLRLIPEVSRRYMMSRRKMTTINDTRDACEYFRPLFMFARTERVFVLLLDNMLRVLSCRELGRGSLDFVNMNVRSVVEMVVNYRASRVILAHNHPGGGITPSPDDYVSTEMLEKALGGFGVQLLDHIIVSGVQAGSIFKANRDYRQIV